VGWVAFTALKFVPYLSSLDRETRAALAAHYGSVSLGTFAAALAFLDGLGIPYNPMVMAWVALMELPAILLGTLLLGLGIQSFYHVLRKDPSLMLLPATFVIGAVVGPPFLDTPILSWVFENAFESVLAYFLFEMGRQAGENLRNLEGKSRWALLLFGIGMPLIGGVVGAALGTALSKLISIGLGEITILSTLGASASYVAAPAAMSATIAGLDTDGVEKAQRAVSTSLTASVGITLPFNIIIGLPFYHEVTDFFELYPLVAAGVLLILFIALVLVWRKSLTNAVNVLFQEASQSAGWKSKAYGKHELIRLLVMGISHSRLGLLKSLQQSVRTEKHIFGLILWPTRKIDSFSSVSHPTIQRGRSPPWPIQVT
jgi:hypothetical protein